MTACRALGASRSLPEVVLEEIDMLHTEIEIYMVWALMQRIEETAVQVTLRDADFRLQDLWGFPRDERFHTYFKKFRFRKAWYGRRFRCKETGDEFTMPIDVQEARCYSVGGGFVDVGRLDCYSRRVGNIEEVV